MQVVTGMFHFPADATRTADRLQEAGVAPERLHLVTPGSPRADLEATLPIEETEGPGVGTVLGGLVGGVLALILSPFFVSGGPFPAIGRTGVTVIVVLGAVILGIVLGTRIERTATRGIPRDDLYLYEEALRRGRSILLAIADAPTEAATIRRELKAAGAEPLDAFGTDWWMGLREVEKAHYEGSTGKPFGEAEPTYRHGYEVALHRRYRGRAYDEVAQELQMRHGDESRGNDFRRGYERGHAYYASRSWMVTTPARAAPATGVRPPSWWR